MANRNPLCSVEYPNGFEYGKGVKSIGELLRYEKKSRKRFELWGTLWKEIRWREESWEGSRVTQRPTMGRGLVVPRGLDEEPGEI